MSYKHPQFTSGITITIASKFIIFLFVYFAFVIF